MFGRYERHISEAYRSIYLDIDEFVAQVRRWCPDPKTILEVGCGEGAVSERLQGAFPVAALTGIDVTSRIGRLYRGPREAVRFVCCEVQQIAVSDPSGFDLVVLCDVLHHVPAASRRALLGAIRATLAPGGVLIFKDWQRSNAPIHWLCYASDRWLTGDKISFMTRDEMHEHLAAAFGQGALAAETRIHPHWNNLATLVRL
jgi:2-polyprenyl-3-methyl-5-hydroxy-6-metoxy-1,4-benzoquinol methylase